MKNVTQSAREKCALARANIITRNGPARAAFSRIDVRMEANRESPPITFRRTRALCLIGLRSSSPRYYNTCKSALLIGISLDIAHAWEGIRHLSLFLARVFFFFLSARCCGEIVRPRFARYIWGPPGVTWNSLRLRDVFPIKAGLPGSVLREDFLRNMGMREEAVDWRWYRGNKTFRGCYRLNSDVKYFIYLCESSANWRWFDESCL